MIAGLDAEGEVVWIDDVFKLAFVFVAALIAMFSFAAGVQGWFAAKLNPLGRLLMFAICLVLFLPRIIQEPTGIPRELVQVGALAVFAAFYGWQKWRMRQHAEHAGEG
jgi:TRAP-type uncharacterized transport system fused permease subunit